MARKFSLKDNPIFQRLQVPKKLEDDSKISVQGVTEDSADLRQVKGSSDNEGHILTLKNRPSKIDPQILTLNEEKRKEKVQEMSFVEPEADLPQVIQATSNSTIEDPTEGQNLTLYDGPSNFDPKIQSPVEMAQKPKAIAAEKLKDELDRDRAISDMRSTDIVESQNLTLKNLILEPALESVPVNEVREAFLEKTPTGDLGLFDNFDKSLFFSFYNEVCDELLPTLVGAEQILYTRLFRLSYGFNRNYCCVSQPVLGEKTGLSRNTVRTALQSLNEKEWIRVIEAGRHVSTKYRVYLPRERYKGVKLDPQKMGGKIRRSNIDGQNLSVSFRGSNINNTEGHKKEVQKLTVNKPLRQLSNVNRRLPTGAPNFDPQKMPPLLSTNNSSTLSEREPDSQSSTLQDLSHAAHMLVEKFYSLLGQHPSTAKSQKSVAECVALLQDGFSSDQIDYAVNWLIAHHPATGSFTRVAHFIDQALKERDREQLASELESRKTAALTSQRLEERRIEEEGRQIDEVIASLSPEALNLLDSDARSLVESENGQVRFGKQTLVQIKIRELIRARYLAGGHR